MSTNLTTKSDPAAKVSDEDRLVNERLTEHLKAHAIRPLAPGAARLPKRGFFAECSALAGLVGLMVVAWLYEIFAGREG